jgi:quercetin dioxygenase-like cupin family protein
MTNDLFSAPVRFAVPILLAVALAQVATPQDRTNDVQAVPAFKESRHHLVFENEWVRVMDVRVPARDTTDYHVHADRHVGVVIATARTWEQRLGEAASAPEDTDHVGDVFDNADRSLPYTHRVGNVSDQPFHYIVGQILRRSGTNEAALPESGGLHLEREVMGAHIYRVKLAPGEATPEHRHARRGLTVQVNNGTLKWEGSAPEGTSKESGAGAWWWRGPGATHLLRNTGSAAVEIVELDWP